MLPGGHLSLPCVSYHRLLAFPEVFAFIPRLLLQHQRDGSLLSQLRKGTTQGWKTA